MAELVRLPDQIYAGTTIVVYFSLADYSPDDGWSLVLGATSADGATTLPPVTAADNGDGRFKLTLTDTETDAIGADPGDWRYQLRVEHAIDGNTVVEVGRFTAHPDFQAGAIDDRAHAEATLAAIEATLLGKASRDQLGYTINGRSLSRMSVAELREWRDSLRAEVEQIIQRERMAQGRATGSRILSRF